MAIYNISTADNYITATESGGTIFFQPLLPSDSPNSLGQAWTVGEDESKTTLTCQYQGNDSTLYLAANSNSEGSYIGAVTSLTDTAYWNLEDDGSIQLMDNGATGLYAVIATNGILSLSKSATSKWKYTKIVSKGSTR